MDGYLKVKSKWRSGELRLVELDDVEHVSEDGENLENMKINIFESMEFEAAKLHQCPRCKAKIKLLTNDPYCPECNWDSLTFYGQKLVRKTA
ncbi:MAG: hypothetical protein QE271_07945 [Bacteriovoracaceae bacterium]|nr:hypothetical protein [Bacteriovoracaceae bacterium]